MHLRSTYICASSDRSNAGQGYKGAFPDMTLRELQQASLFYPEGKLLRGKYNLKLVRDPVNVPYGILSCVDHLDVKPYLSVDKVRILEGSPMMCKSIVTVLLLNCFLKTVQSNISFFL